MLYGDLDPHLQRIFDRFHAARILCVGDVMLDEFVYGGVERVSAEAPVPVLHVDSRQAMLGGVGNVGRNVVALGAHAVLITVMGDDDAANAIADLAEAEERLTPRLIVEPGRSSTVKTRYIADGQQLLRTDNETTEPISEKTAARLLTLIQRELPSADVMVLSDYLKGVLTDDVLTRALALAQEAGVPVVADPKREDLGLYAGVTVLKPNRAELSAAARRPCETNEQVEAAAFEVMQASGVDAILVSRSEQGMSLVERGAKPLHRPANALEVFDVSGAGDTVVATTAVALAAGAELRVAADLANVAGGIVVGKVGTAVVSRDELSTGLRAVDASSAVAKVQSVEAARAAVERWRKQGHRVGFTNGCFDLLHPGHVSLLSEARHACDRLIVAINSDDSVKRLKGEDRPIQGEDARAVVLAALGMVDLVVVFGDDTPIPLLEILKPDVLIKGGDYTIDEVVGAEVVRAHGGDVKIARHVAGHSTSQSIARMNGGPRRFPRPYLASNSNRS